MGCDKSFQSSDNIEASPEANEIDAKAAKLIATFSKTVSLKGDQVPSELIKAVTYPLADPNDPAHKIFSETVLRNVAGNEIINEAYKEALPDAVARIAKHTPDVTGLVASSRGRGASSLDKNLKHSTRGDAFAYELLGTAEILRQSGLSGKPMKASNGGRGLFIGKNDRIDLGVKLQADYHSNEVNRPAGTGIYNKLRTTIEADALISRGAKTGAAPIAVDFKHTRNNGSCKSRDSKSSANKQPFKSQLDGIENAIRTGDIGEFHFVTNGTFADSMKGPIEDLNLKLNESFNRSGENLVSTHEHCRYPQP